MSGSYGARLFRANKVGSWFLYLLHLFLSLEKRFRKQLQEEKKSTATNSKEEVKTAASKKEAMEQE